MLLHVLLKELLKASPWSRSSSSCPSQSLTSSTILSTYFPGARFNRNCKYDFEYGGAPAFRVIYSSIIASFYLNQGERGLWATLSFHHAHPQSCTSICALACIAGAMFTCCLSTMFNIVFKWWAICTSALCRWFMPFPESQDAAWLANKADRMRGKRPCLLSGDNNGSVT